MRLPNSEQAILDLRRSKTIASIPAIHEAATRHESSATFLVSNEATPSGFVNASCGIYAAARRSRPPRTKTAVAGASIFPSSDKVDKV